MADTSALLRKRLQQKRRLPGAAYQDDQERLRIDVFVATGHDTLEVKQKILDLGGVIERRSSTLLVCRVRVNVLRTLASLHSVLRLNVPAEASTDLTTVISSGDAELLAARARQNYGVSGRGIKIGVISDGAESVDAVLRAGELGNAVSAKDDVIGYGGGWLNEGTAMMEIIHDLAPDAQQVCSFLDDPTKLPLPTPPRIFRL